jgi:hypothetical protein
MSTGRRVRLWVLLSVAAAGLLAVDVNTHPVSAREEEEQGRPVARLVVFDALIGTSSDRQ